MMKDLYKNPIVLGILVAALTYAFLWWREEQKHKQNPEEPKKKVNVLIPGVTGGLTWFVLSSYFDYSKQNQQKGGELTTNTEIHKLENTKLSAHESDSDNDNKSDSYRMVSRGVIQPPDQDIFLSLAEW